MIRSIVLAIVAISAISVQGKPNTGKIIGGEEATANEFPWMVQIQIRGQHYCGGAIYNNEWIVTGAHCATSNPYDYVVVAGKHNLSATEITQQRRMVIQTVLHPQYDSAAGLAFENDIGLMKVTPPFEFNEAVQPALFAPPGFFPTGAPTVSGWGQLAEIGNSSDTLQKVNVPIVSDAECDVAYGGNAIADSMLCAGQAGRDACVGDSGGPLLCRDGVFPDNVCGIVSWGRGCGRSGYPGVYTEVSYFQDWLAEAVRTLPEPEDNSTYVEQQGCGGVLRGSNGKIEYLLNTPYRNHERCSWTIRATRETIRFTIDQSGLAPGDFLTVTQLDASQGNIVRRARLDQDNYMILLPGHFAIMTFNSNGEDVGTGFSVLFQGIGNLVSDGGWPIRSHYNQLGNNSVGSFSYPMGGGNYNDNELTTITVNSETPFMTFRVDRMDMEGGPDCLFDQLHIYSHSETSGFSLTQIICGDDLGTAITSDGLVLLVFITDSSINGSGFTASWAGVS